MNKKIIGIPILISLMLIGCSAQTNYNTYKKAKVVDVRSDSCYRGCNPNVDLKVEDNTISVKANEEKRMLLHKGNIVDIEVDNDMYVQSVKLSVEKKVSN